MRLLLVPHAPTAWNAVGRYQGHSDTTLSDIGREQARALAARLAEEQIDHVHSSDLRRAAETARIICESRGLIPRSDSRLRELHFGAWEGMTYDEARQTHGAALSAWEVDSLRNSPPDGETVAQLGARIGDFLKEICDEPDSDTTILVVAHRGSLRVFICLALEMPAEVRWRIHLESASLSVLNLTKRGAVLTSLNDIHHLREGVHAG